MWKFIIIILIKVVCKDIQVLDMLEQLKLEKPSHLDLSIYMNLNTDAVLLTVE